MKRTIALTGGGSGGHITPVIAVAEALKKAEPDLNVVYIGQKGDNLSDIPEKNQAIDSVYSIRAGKFRRYHGEGWRQILDIKTMILNIRDFFYVLVGIFQARSLLKALQPDAIFVKGGFVGVPVGLAAANLHIPFITHDSDAIPGLANKIVARWATLHAVALPKEVYSYPPDKTVSTGIPLRQEFVPVTPDMNTQYRTQIDIPQNAKFLFIIGGGLGSQRVNQAVVEIVPHLLSEFSDLYIVHVVGRLNENEIQETYKKKIVKTAEAMRLRTYGYIDDVYRYSGAADLIICRAGATNLAEFSVQGKACVVVPSPFLTGGHQLKNANFLKEKGAIEVLDEVNLTTEPNRLAKSVSALLRDEPRQRQMCEKFSSLGHTDAAARIADLLIKTAKTFAEKG